LGPEPQVVGYKLFYGTSPGNYTTTIPVGLQTTYTVTGLADGTTYLFAVQSFDGSGNTSPLSQELSGTTASSSDTTPDPFSFTAQTGVPRGTLVTSNSVRVTGINAAAAISISGGEYSISGGVFTSSAGTVSAGQTVTVRQTSSANFSKSTTATLTIGGVSGGFTVTTVAADTTPNAFAFTAQTNVTRSTVIVSNSIAVAGINTAAPIAVAGGEYSIGGGAYTASAGTLNAGQTVTVRQTSSASFSTSTMATVTIGGVSGEFTVTTEAADTTPTPFSFTAQTNVLRSTVVMSNSITVAGINAPAAVSVSGGEYAIGSGAYTASAGTVTAGQIVTVRQTSSASYATPTATTLTIGGVTGTFTVTTENQPPPPGAFSKASPANNATEQPTNPTLTWNASNGATGYEYCYDTTNNNACDTSWIDVSSATTASLTSLAPAMNYYWQVRARNATSTTAANSGAWWSVSTLWRHRYDQRRSHVRDQYDRRLRHRLHLLLRPDGECEIVSASGGTGSIGVLAAAGCAWTVLDNSTWVTVDVTAGTGDGTVGYTAAANAGTASRTAVLSISGQTFTLTAHGNERGRRRWRWRW
jgi:hypothetical protein